MSTDSPPLGKFGKSRLEKYVFPFLEDPGNRSSDLHYGSDYNTIKLDEEHALIVSTDPLAISPQLGWQRSAKLALHVITTDVAVSGIPPSHLVVNWNLPPDMEDETFAEIWHGFTNEAEEVGIKIAGGHTGRYGSQEYPIVGAGTALGFGSFDDILPGGISTGDKIYLLNELGLEAAAIFAFYYPKALAEMTSKDHLSEVKQKFEALQPTQNLTSLVSAPGVRLVHDIAEGGFLGGLQEITADRGLGARIGTEEFEVDPRVAQICNKLDLDPTRITSIGSGIAIVSPRNEEEFFQDATEEGLEVEAAGEITESGEIELVTDEGLERVTESVHDEFWKRLSEFKAESA